MSLIKTLIEALQGKVNTVELESYELFVDLQNLAEFCWSNGGDYPVCSPSQETIDSLSANLDRALAALSDIKAAHSILQAGDGEYFDGIENVAHGATLSVKSTGEPKLPVLH